jgi:hypothetical protein
MLTQLRIRRNGTVILSSTHYKRHAKKIHKNKNDSHLPFIPMPRSNNKKRNIRFKNVN